MNAFAALAPFAVLTVTGAAAWWLGWRAGVAEGRRLWSSSPACRLHEPGIVVEVDVEAVQRAGRELDRQALPSVAHYGQAPPAAMTVAASRRDLEHARDDLDRAMGSYPKSHPVPPRPAPAAPRKEHNR